MSEQGQWQSFCEETGRDWRTYSNIHLFVEFAEWWAMAGGNIAPTPTNQLTFRQFLVINSCSYPCPRCGEGTSFEVSMKDEGWITCAACHYILKSGIEPAKPGKWRAAPKET
jgi:ribosomal protein S27AE